MNNWHKKRIKSEARFKNAGRMAMALSVLLLAVLLASIISRGYMGFVQAQIRLPITFDAALLARENGGNAFSASSFNLLVQEALKERFPDVTGHAERHQLYALVSVGAGGELKRALERSPELQKSVGIWLPASSDIDMLIKGHAGFKLNAAQIGWLDRLRSAGEVRLAFNTAFFTRGDSRTPERA